MFALGETVNRPRSRIICLPDEDGKKKKFLWVSFPLLDISPHRLGKILSNFYLKVQSKANRDNFLEKLGSNTNIDESCQYSVSIHSHSKVFCLFDLLPRLAVLSEQESCLWGMRPSVTLFLYQRNRDKLK